MKFLLGLVVGVCLPILAGYIFIKSGGLPVPTKGPPLPLEKAIAKMALHVAMDPEVGKPAPIAADEANFVAGAKIYQTQCAVCHGMLGRQETGIAKGMFPHPPQLLPPHKGVTNDLIGEIYWKVKNGIRLTGMPGYSETLSDTELWQVSLLLLHAKQLPESISPILSQP